MTTASEIENNVNMRISGNDVKLGDSDSERLYAVMAERMEILIASRTEEMKRRRDSYRERKDTIKTAYAKVSNMYIE